MNFLNLEYFLVAAEELNFTKAAKRLYISQQSLSNHIQKLEEYFNAPLFDRNPPMTLTSSGKCLVKRAKEILSIKNQADKEIRDIRDFRSGEITIGVTHTRGRVILPSILPIYHKTYPNIKINLFEGNSEAIEEALRAGKVDLIIGFTPRDNSDVESVPLFEENILMIVPNKVLAEQFPESFEQVKTKLIQSADLKLVKDCPFILMDPCTKVGAFSNTIFKQAAVAPNIILQTKNIETMLALCLEGMGIIFCPEIFVLQSPVFSQSHAPSNITVCRLADKEACTTIAVSFLKNKYLTQAAEKLIEILKDKTPRFSAITV